MNWNSMGSAPRDATEVRVVMKDGTVHERAHWACDLSGEEQPAYKSNCRWWNLPALCQRCHLSIQTRVVMRQPYIFEHSGWFKPYAAGFYAWKYLHQDLSREQVTERLEELLALERIA